MTDDFSDAPETIGELRSAKTRKSTDWTPRDALINMLRSIDSGEWSPDTLIVTTSAADEKGNVRHRYNAASNAGSTGLHECLGLLEATKLKLWADSE